MFCQQCGEKPATVHLTKIHNHQSTEVHLCESCALQKGELELGLGSPGLWPQLLAGLAGLAVEGADDGLHCSHCGHSYQEFARTGRLGCPACYGEMKEQLEPLMGRLQEAAEHTGKVPVRRGYLYRHKREVRALQNELRERIDREEFEQAAEIRDLLRALEREEGGKLDEPGGASR